ncbi:hypothetical protein [Thalassospira marina]|uniref:Uncharacterized protein n=1 Tax=Thalassospira marina TaxID=2048283 RepID=A0A2N3KX05_9PROT|nr:hypothetical protein [Thalassospira marina]PKR55037.1 hypothetical protein COO20_06530 [Thalassospira marina]
MSDTNKSFTVITHRVRSMGDHPAVAYSSREAKTFDASTPIGEIMTWATGDGVDDDVAILTGTYKRNGLHLIEIAIPDRPDRRENSEEAQHPERDELPF